MANWLKLFCANVNVMLMSFKRFCASTQYGGNFALPDMQCACLQSRVPQDDAILITQDGETWQLVNNK